MTLLSQMQLEAIYYRNRGSNSNDTHMLQTADVLEAAIAVIQDMQDGLADLTRGEPE